MRAAADGRITRVRVSESGYGRALDLALPDGRVVVYAHLSRFTGAIEDSCRARQERSGSFDVDWIPQVGAFRFARGEVLGWTGETADGRGILHMETRIGGIPRNPLRSGFSWPDHVPPRIHAIRYVPLGPTARIDGRLESEVVDAETASGGRLSGVKTVVWGPIGVECEASDDAGGSRRAPFRVRLYVDGVLHYSAEVGSGDLIDGRSSSDPEPAASLLLLQRLYRPSEHDRGRLLCGTSLRTGPHRLRITVRDVSGNVDSTSTLILVQRIPRVEEWMNRPIGDGDWDVGVRVGPADAGDPEGIRLSLELTEDGKHFPVETDLGHIGSGWFLGSVSSTNPTGRLGMRIRMRTQDGLDTRGPVLSLDPAGACGAAAADSPAVTVAPHWVEVDERGSCMPASAPKGTLLISGRSIPCDLLETTRGEENRGRWRFVAPPPPEGDAGSSPYFSLDLDRKQRRWRLPAVVLAEPGADLLWTTPDGALTVEIPAGTFYAPVWLSWERSAIPEARVAPVALPSAGGAPGQAEVLVSRSDAHSMRPSNVDVDGAFRIAMRPRRLPTTSEEARRLGIYGRRGPSSPWTARGGLWTGSAVVAVVDRLEEWIVLEDCSEPWLYGLDPAPGERRVGRLSFLSAQVREEGSGVTGGSFEVYLDGRRIPAGWNPESRRLRAPLLDPIGPGPHRWEVRAVDAAGNTASRAATFTLTPQP